MAYTSAGPSYVNSPFEQSHSSRAQSETTAGEFWTLKRDGEDWPVVICDDEIVQTFFKGRQRPFNARRPDGTWADGYKSGEDGIGQRCYPAILLGKLKFVWAPWKMLEPIDEEIGEVIRVSTTNPEFAEAWREAIQHIGKEAALSYFKDRLRQQRSERFKSKVPAQTTPEKRKRKGTPKFKFPPGYRREEVDDEESNHLFLQEIIAHPKIKRKLSDLTPSAEMEALYEDTDAITLPEPASKRSKMTIAGRFASMHPTTPFRSATVNPSSSEKRRSVSRATPTVETRKKDLNDPSRVMIYVDNPHKKFRVKRSGLNASPLLSSLVAQNPENGWYLMSPMLSDLNADDFLPIGQYLERGEYDPNILDEGTEWVRLEKDLAGPERGAEVIRCATIYSTAQMLQLPGLQALAFRKLEALAKWEPHQPFAILCVVDLVFEKGNDDLRQYLMQYLAKHYWDLILAETVKISEMMQANKKLAWGVHGLLSKQAGAETAMEVDQEVKKENETENAKVEQEGSFLSEDTAKEDNPDKEKVLAEEAKEMKIREELQKKIGNETRVFEEGKKAAVEDEKDDGFEKGDKEIEEGISQTEQEMVMMALRESDKEATEEDLTRMMEEQSKFFEAY